MFFKPGLTLQLYNVQDDVFPEKYKGIVFLLFEV